MFYDEVAEICGKESYDMEHYERICSLMMGNMPAFEAAASFSAICMSAGVHPADVDMMFYEELGMSGEEVVRALGRGTGKK